VSGVSMQTMSGGDELSPCPEYGQAEKHSKKR